MAREISFIKNAAATVTTEQFSRKKNQKMFTNKKNQKKKSKKKSKKITKKITKTKNPNYFGVTKRSPEQWLLHSDYRTVSPYNLNSRELFFSQHHTLGVLILF
jgi:hypothetical protein